MVLVCVILYGKIWYPALCACKSVLHVLDNYARLACVTTIALITLMAGEVLHKAYAVFATIPSTTVDIHLYM